jgi:hypothetical protein
MALLFEPRGTPFISFPSRQRQKLPIPMTTKNTRSPMSIGAHFRALINQDGAMLFVVIIL